MSSPPSWPRTCPGISSSGTTTAFTSTRPMSIGSRTLRRAVSREHVATGAIPSLRCVRRKAGLLPATAARRRPQRPRDRGPVRPARRRPCTPLLVEPWPAGGGVRGTRSRPPAGAALHRGEQWDERADDPCPGTGPLRGDRDARLHLRRNCTCDALDRNRTLLLRHPARDTRARPRASRGHDHRPDQCDPRCARLG